MHIIQYTIYMKLSVSITLHPSYDNVRLRHLSIWREAKTNPACGADIHCKANSLLFQVKVPVQCVAIVQNGRESILFLQVVGTRTQLHKCSEEKQDCGGIPTSSLLHIVHLLHIGLGRTMKSSSIVAVFYIL